MGQFRRLPIVAIVLGALGIVAAALGFVGWRVSRALHQSAIEVRAEHQIRLTEAAYVPPASVDFESFSSPEVFLQLAQFQGHLYVASPAGLLEYDSRGAFQREFFVGRDLPASPVVALAVGVPLGSPEPELIVATAADGLLFYNGHAFRQVYPADPDFRAITAILPVSAGHVLIGTKKKGVLLYDGKQLSQLHPTLSNLYIQALAGSEVDLWVGTLTSGVLHWRAGATDAFTEAQGLPDRQVQTVVVSGEQTYAGTVMGVAVFEQGRFSRVVAPGVLVTSLLVEGDNLLVGSEEQGILRVPFEAHRLKAPLGNSSPVNEVRQFVQGDNGTFVLTRNGLYQAKPGGVGWTEVLQPRPAVLSDRNISALAVDRGGQVWVGFFDRGLDVLTNDTRRAVHVEDNHVFCINRIWTDEKSGNVAVGTANGLVQFDAAGKVQHVLTRADGLIADHVTDVAPYLGGLAVATPAGLTFLDASGARSMYAFHGLVSNHIYALGVSGDDMLVGTLGGLSTIAKGDIRSSYSAGSSGLRQNWITAVVPVGDGWMVGTYGGGVVELDRAGHFRSFEKATGEVEINPNAMLVTARFVFAGTLGKGLYVYDRSTQLWSVKSVGLPSPNVTALAEGNGYLYVGTDNGLVRIQEQKIQP